MRLILDVMPITNGASGSSLRLQRRAAGIATPALATAMRISPARIRALESQAHVRPSTASRYLDGLAAAHEERARDAVREVIERATGDLVAVED